MRVLVLESYKVIRNSQRIIYDATQDRIIHQFKKDGRGKWIEDQYTPALGDTHYANEYLPNLNVGV